ncbi:hypothetical protein BC830DRAFT_241579 [Chytriomyces sp. MP71]|nr:hypothetical protein BC830DRAFT_241579 [Chytriomyces sp. MP71]
MAKLTLAERYHELDVSPGLPDPEIAVALLLQEFKFDAAFKLAKTFDIGLETVFSEFGACCVSLTENDKNGTPTYMKPLIEEAPVGWEGSASAKAWLALQLRLEHYQSDYRINVYRKAAIDGSLSKNSKIDLPLWLVKSLQDAKPEDLIRVYLHHNLVERAAVIATEFVQKRTKALPDYGDKIKPSHCNKWLPFGTIDQTLVALDGELQRLENLLDEDDEMNCDDTEDTLQDLEKRRKELAGALYQYLSKIRDETLIFAPNTNMESAPLADQISFSLKYDVQPEDRVSRGGSGGGGGGVFSRLGPAITSPSGHSTLARLGPEISTPSKIGSTGAGAFSFSGSGASAFGSISGAATANFANTSTRGSSGGGLFGDLAPVVAFNTFGASSLTPPPPSNSLSFGAGPGLSPDGPKEYAGEKYKKRAERKGANPI